MLNSKSVTMKKAFIFFTLLSIGTSCSDLDLAPLDSESELSYWETKEDATIFLNSMYADLMSADTYLFLNALSDDAYSKANEDIRNIGNGNYDPSNGTVRAHWAGRYEGIRRANIFLENIDRVTVLTETEKRTLLAQARFIRAWHYFYLTQLFGDVPLI